MACVWHGKSFLILFVHLIDLRKQKKKAKRLREVSEEQNGQRKEDVTEKLSPIKGMMRLKSGFVQKSGYDFCQQMVQVRGRYLKKDSFSL